MESYKQRIQTAITTAQKGILINTALVVVKILTGILGNSYALIADGVESAADVFCSLIVWKGLSIAKKDASPEYHFGYGRAETISGAIVSIFLIGAALAVFIVALREIVTPHHLPEFFTLPILVSVIVIKELLFRFVSKVGNEVDSSALKGDAWHHRADAITSLAAFIGISVALIGGPGWEPADDYAALVCAFVIGSTGLNLLRRSVAELMDRAPDESILNNIREVASSVSGVKLVEKILARKSGLNYLVELHIHADPLMSLHDAHILGGTVKTQLRRQLPAIGAVTIHMEPTNGDA